MALKVQVTFDTADPEAQARFWALALGYQEQPPPEGFESWDDFARTIGLPEERWHDLAAVVDPSGAGPRLLFQKVPEGKAAKNRVHLDVDAGGATGSDDPHVRRAARDAHVNLLAHHGAQVLRYVDEPTGQCVVMADPEGNEFCVV
jgi:Glyoxalase-like domain